jgi:hypothetical protein
MVLADRPVEVRLVGDPQCLHQLGEGDHGVRVKR